MNRFKKYIRQKGIKLECDYPYIPYDLGTLSVEGIAVNSETCTVYIDYCTIVHIVKINRDGTLKYSWN